MMSIKEQSKTFPLYRVTQSKIVDEDGGEHDTYGIEAVGENGDVLERIDDICLCRSQLEEAVSKMNKGKLALIHLDDVVENIMN